MRERFIEIHQTVNFGYGWHVAVKQDELVLVDRWLKIDEAEVDRHASFRNGNKRKNKISDMKVDRERSSLAVDWSGACGEVAAAQWLGVELPMKHYLRGDPGYDLISRTGLKVEVKATEKPHGMLFFGNIEQFSVADVAVLVVVGSRIEVPV